jgi:hypothetical protein
MTRKQMIDAAVLWAAKSWYSPGEMESLRRISRAGKSALNKRQTFCNMIRKEYARIVAKEEH